MITTVLLILAWISFLLTSLNVNPFGPRINLFALGFVFWVSALLVGPVSRAALV